MGASMPRQGVALDHPSVPAKYLRRIRPAGQIMGPHIDLYSDMTLQMSLITIWAMTI